MAASEAYAMKVDPATGTVQDGQWIDGSAPGATALTLSGGKVWIAGATPAPDVPITPGTLVPQGPGVGLLAGAYVSAVDFSAGVNQGPAIACVVDAGNLTHVGAVAPLQLLTVFGRNLSAAGALFDGAAATVLYASPSQINLAVPATALAWTTLQLTANGASVARRFPVVPTNLNLFADLSADESDCLGPNSLGFQPVALNADGSANSCTNGASSGSTISFFLHGVGAPAQAPLTNLAATVRNCAVPIASTEAITDFVYKIDLAITAQFVACVTSAPVAVVDGNSPYPVTFTYNNAPVGPLAAQTGAVFEYFQPGTPLPLVMWVQ